MRPGGVCVLSTPARLRSFLWGEPHYGLRGIAALPLKWQETVATRMFGRRYPFAVTRQYLAASQVLRPFREAGLEGAPVAGGRLSAWLSRLGMRGVGEALLWSFLVVRRPGPGSGEEVPRDG